MDYEKFSRLYRRRFDEGRIEVWDTIQTYNNKKKKKKSGGPFILGAQQCLATKPVCYIRMAL